MQKRIERLDADRFDWMLLRSFLAIYRAGTVAGAARTLSHQQSTLSRHLTELEAQLAEPLFERTGRGLHATDAAHIVARYAQQMESLAHELSLSLTAKSETLTGTVRVSASQIFSSYLLPGIVTDLIRRYPGLQIEMVSSDEVPSILNRATDIALRFSQPTDLNLVARRLGPIPIAAVAHHRYLQAMGTPETGVDLLHHHLVGIDKDTVMIPTLHALGIAVSAAQFRLRPDDKAVSMKLVESGAGIGFVARLVVDLNPDLRQVLPHLALPTLQCWITTHTEIASNPLIRIVFDAIAERISAILGGGQRALDQPEPPGAQQPNTQTND